MNDLSIDQDDEEAALWVARQLGGPVDVAAFSEWLNAAPGRKEKFDALWATCADEVVTDALRLNDRPERRLAAPRRSIPAVAAYAALAAALVVGVILAWPLARFALSPALTYETAAGQVRNVALADGSTVALNGASRIRAKIGGARREVTLERGEALFDVRHDKNRPFVVAAGDGRVTVLGTRFDVALNRERVDLEVERGLVRFDKALDRSTGVLVPASHRASLTGGAIAPPSPLHLDTAAAWRTGWLEASDMPLAEILPRLERWSSKPIFVRDQALLQKRVAGRFRLSNPKAVLDSLGALGGFEVQETGQAYVIDTR